MESLTKVCIRCKQEKPIERFRTAYGHTGKKYKTGTCADCLNAFNRARGERYHRKSNLKRKYNLSMDEYEQISLAQNGVCAICGKPETFKQRGKVRKLAVDHNHETGEVRGLLCAKCNIWLGTIENSKFQEFVPLAHQYLSTFN